MKELCLSMPGAQFAEVEPPDADRLALLGALARQALVAEAELPGWHGRGLKSSGTYCPGVKIEVLLVRDDV